MPHRLVHRTLAAVFLVAAPLAATAQDSAPVKTAGAPEIWINLGGFSRHFSNSHQYEESNLGIGVEVRTAPDLSFMAGAYRNSLSKTTHYAAVNWQPWTIGPVKVGAAVGLLNGYPAISRGGTFFAALPMATFEGRHFGVNVGVIPSIKNVDGAVLIQFKWRAF